MSEKLRALANDVIPPLMRQHEQEDMFFAAVQTSDCAYNCTGNMKAVIRRRLGNHLGDMLDEMSYSLQLIDHDNLETWSADEVDTFAASLFTDRRPLLDEYIKANRTEFQGGNLNEIFAMDVLPRELLIRKTARDISEASYNGEFIVGDDDNQQYQTDPRARQFLYDVAKTLVLEHDISFYDLWT